MRRPTVPFFAALFASLLLFCALKSDPKGPREGDMAPEIRMPNAIGDTLKLSSLKGHVVLVHFWASWCVHCREESRSIVDISHKYYDKKFKTGKGLIILYVSLDDNKSSWIKAIHQDELSMKYNVSDLKGWKNFAVQTYNVSTIPCNYLVDGEGKIISQGENMTLIEQDLRDEMAK